jgi:hypothetical protein
MLIDGEYVITPEDRRLERAKALLENEEAGQYLKAVHGKIRAIAVQLEDVGKAFLRLASVTSQPYVEELFLEELKRCTECFDPEVLSLYVSARVEARFRFSCREEDQRHADSQIICRDGRPQGDHLDQRR